MSARKILLKWLDATLEHPARIDIVSVNETHYFKTIEENDGRCLKVVFNPVTATVITVYFDRTMRKRGCK